MQIVDLPLISIRPAAWNPNQMDAASQERLGRSIERFGLVAPLVVRRIGSGSYETVGGAQRLAVLEAMAAAIVPCVVVEADDAEARLLAQALNRISGEDDLGLRANALRHVLESLPVDEVLAVLPESAESLKSLLSMGQESIAERLRSWQMAQAARLKHLTFQLAPKQLEVVQRALAFVIGQAREGESNPNRRGNALYELCQAYLELSAKPIRDPRRRIGK